MWIVSFKAFKQLLGCEFLRIEEFKAIVAAILVLLFPQF
jgi:hypothetical protein